MILEFFFGGWGGILHFLIFGGSNNFRNRGGLIFGGTINFFAVYIVNNLLCDVLILLKFLYFSGVNIVYVFMFSA